MVQFYGRFISKSLKFNSTQIEDIYFHQFTEVLIFLNFLFCRLNNVFIIGKGSKPYISLPRGKGVKLSIAEERDRRLAAKATS